MWSGLELELDSWEMVQLQVENFLYNQVQEALAQNVSSNQNGNFLY